MMGNQKSTHFPLTTQSPNLVGYGPFGLYPYYFSITFVVDASFLGTTGCEA